ncbi:MAG: DUF1819 family protein [Anaerolineales bacterium]|nr:DUF1819 family protein [Anaerolineales bacterium]
MSAEPAASRYTTKLIKASALIPDTRALLQAWNLAQDTAENLARVRRQNLFGKASRSRVEDILQIFRQRYFSDPDVGRALVILAQAGAPDAWLVPLFYFFSAQNDRTLRDVVLETVLPRRAAGYADVDLSHVERQLHQWIAESQTTTAWAEITVKRVAQNGMATLRDFGVLRGDINKEIAALHLPVEPAAFIAYWLSAREGSGYGVLHSPEWQLFFLSVDGVERTLIQAQQQHLLTYQSLGSVIRLDFFADSMEGYARVLAARLS